MQDIIDQLDEVIHTCWQTMLGQDLTNTELQEPWRAKGTPGMMACIQITGNWSGAVTIECSSALARTMAEEMFGMEPGEAADDEILDALGELVNVIGGNIKALVDGGAELSLPAVTSGIDYKVVMPGSSKAAQLGFDYGGEPVRVGLLCSSK